MIRMEIHFVLCNAETSASWYTEKMKWITCYPLSRPAIWTAWRLLWVHLEGNYYPSPAWTALLHLSPYVTPWHTLLRHHAEYHSSSILLRNSKIEGAIVKNRSIPIHVGSHRIGRELLQLRFILFFTKCVFASSGDVIPFRERYTIELLHTV